MAGTCNGTLPCVVEGYGARLYYIPYEYGTIIGPEQWWHDYDKNWFYLFVTGYWSVTILVAIAYVIGVHLLQRSMLNRKPFDLRWPHLIWNACFALFSLVGFIRMSEEILFLLRTRPLLDSISYSWDPHQPVAFWALCCITSKFFALVDTVFIVLRKRPLLFLHWYHHASVLIASWHSAKECVACTRWFILINFGVASITYAYFAAKLVGIRRRRIVSMAVTMLEIAQMIAGVLISCFVLHYKLQGHRSLTVQRGDRVRGMKRRRSVYRTPVMQQSYENLAIFFTIYISFVILFTVFFKDAYIINNDKKIR